jgi:hypothetical protein
MQLTKPMCMAIPTALLVDPPMLLAFHATSWGTMGYVPMAIKKVAMYSSARLLVAPKMMKPVILVCKLERAG